MERHAPTVGSNYKTLKIPVQRPGYELLSEMHKDALVLNISRSWILISNPAVGEIF